MKTLAKTEGELLFERYLADNGLAGGDDHHPDLGHRRQPDYRVRGETTAICEIKQFGPNSMSRKLSEAIGRAIVVSDNDVYGPVRNAISSAAKEQLRPFADRGEPLVVVLANPLNAEVSFDPEDVHAAMYGNPGYEIPVYTGTGPAPPMPPGHGILGQDGCLSAKHRYLSAVVTLHQREHSQDYWEEWNDRRRRRLGESGPPTRFDDAQARAVRYLEERNAHEAEAEIPEGDYVFARVHETYSATITGEAARLGADLFSGPHDERWVIDPATGTYGRV